MRVVHNMLKGLRNSVSNIFRRNVVTSFNHIGTRNPVVTLRGSQGMEREAEYFLPYGFYSRPPANTECISLAIDGEDHLITTCITSGKAMPEDTQSLEVGLINDSGTVRLRLLSNGTLLIDANNVVINSNVAINGNLTTTGTINADGNISGGGVSLDSHVHGGVDTGTGVTQPPQ